MAGTGIGTFNDRLRDAVRGGGPFDDDPRIQGFGSGPVHRPQRRPDQRDSAATSKSRAAAQQDLIKVGLTGNLKDYTFVDRTGATGHRRPGRLQRPAGRLHRRPAGVDQLRRRPRQRDALRRAGLQAAVVDLDGRTGSGCRPCRWRLPPLGRASRSGKPGSEMLRSKSFDRNSYDSGDWFNVLDYGHDTNGFGRGLPPARQRGKWPYKRRCSPTPGSTRTAGRSSSAETMPRTLLGSGAAARCSTWAAPGWCSRS